MSQRQYNVYFGQNSRDLAAHQVVERLRSEEISVHDLFKQVLLQIEEGSLKFDTKTMRVKGDPKADELFRMVKEIHQIVKSGQLRLITDPLTPDNGDGVPRVVVSKEVMQAFDEMED